MCGKEKEGSFIKSSVEITNVSDKHLDLLYATLGAKSEKKKLTLQWADTEEKENVSVESLKDVKNKLVAMAKYAAARQGYSHVQINKVIYPSGTIFEYPLVISFILGLYDLELLKSIFTRDALVQKVSQFFPNFVWTVLNTAYSTLGLQIILGIIAFLHIFELFFVLLPKLRKYRVPTSQRFIWSVMQLFEGFPVLLRLKTLEPKD